MKKTKSKRSNSVLPFLEILESRVTPYAVDFVMSEVLNVSESSGFARVAVSTSAFNDYGSFGKFAVGDYSATVNFKATGYAGRGYGTGPVPSFSVTKTFTKANPTAILDIPIENDIFFEPNGQFFVYFDKLPGQSSWYIYLPYWAPEDLTVVNVINDDLKPTVSTQAIISPASEINGQAILNLDIPNSWAMSAYDPRGVLYLDYDVIKISNSATESDVVFSTTINQAVYNKKLVVPLLNDNFFESIEYFKVKIKKATIGFAFGSNYHLFGTGNYGPNYFENLEILNSEGLVTIIDDDPPPVVSFTKSSITVPENSNTFTFQANLIGSTAVPAKINFLISNLTTNANDYGISSGSITFDPGETSKTISIQITNDSIYEETEFFQIKLDQAENCTISTSSTINVSIIDDDPVPSVQFASSTGSSFENKNPGITINLSGQSQYSVKAKYSVQPITAQNNIDFISNQGEITFLPGEQTAFIPLTLINDSLNEYTETLVITLTDITNGITGTINSQLFSIYDDDSEPQIFIDDVVISEGTGGNNQALSKIRLSTISGKDVIFSIGTTNGTAIAGQDYISGNSSQLVIPAGQMETIFITQIISDQLIEENEFFEHALTNVANASPGKLSSKVFILNDDGKPGLVINDLTIMEGIAGIGKATLTVSLTEPVGMETRLKYRTVDGSAFHDFDFIAVSNNDLVIPSGSLTGTIELSIIDDDIYELNESFTVVLSSDQDLNIYKNTAIVVISNDDPLPTISLGSPDFSIREENLQGTIAVSLNHPSGFPVKATVAAYAESADSLDFSFQSATIIFQPGETKIILPFSVFDDLLNEAFETFRIAITGQEGSVLGLMNSILVSIEDNDPLPEIKFTSSQRLSKENDTNNLKIMLSAASGQEVRVDVMAVEGTAKNEKDYLLASQSLIFAPGETIKELPIYLFDDSLNEDSEQFQIVLSNPKNAILGSSSSLTFTIIDDDPVPLLTPSNLFFSENGDAIQFAKVDLNVVSGRDIILTYQTSNITAESGKDYSSNDTFNILIPAGVATALIPIQIFNDNIYETEEYFNLVLQANHAFISNPSVSISIFDDETDPVPSFTLGQDIFIEGDGNRTIHLEFTTPTPSSKEKTISYKIANSGTSLGADYLDPCQGQVTLQSGETQKTILLEILGDKTDEPTESFIISLLDSNQVAVSTQIVIIEDDDHAEFFGDGFRILNAEGFEFTSTSIEYSVKNFGTIANSTSVAFYASDDSTISSSDGYLGSSPIWSEPLQPGETRTRIFDFILPLNWNSSQMFIGMIINPNDAQHEFNTHPNSNAGIGIDFAKFNLLKTKHEIEPNGAIANATTIGPKTIVTGNFTRKDDFDWFHFSLIEAGRFQILARTKSGFPFSPSITLVNQNGELILDSIQSNPITTDGVASMDIFLAEGDYYISLRPANHFPNNMNSDYEFKTSFIPTINPLSVLQNRFYSREMSQGDFNGDGNIDFLSLNFETVSSWFTNKSNLSIAFGLGGGYFQEIQNRESNNSLIMDAASILAKDLDIDGKTEIITFNERPIINVFGLDYDGNLFLKNAYDVGSGIYSLNFGNVNPNVGEEFIVGSYKSVFILGTDGKFLSKLNVPFTFSKLASYDIDGNGFEDILGISDETIPQLVAFTNFEGIFSEPIILATGVSKDFLIVGNFDSDATKELLFSNSLNTNWMIIDYSNNNTKTTSFRPKTSFKDLVTGDFDLDGKLDVGMVSSDSYFSVYTNSGNFNFDFLSGYNSGAYSDKCINGDFNQDGLLDVVVSNGFLPSSMFDFRSSPNTFQVLLGARNGHFLTGIHNNFQAGVNPSSMIEADFNNDGIQDLAIANKDENTVSIFIGNLKTENSYQPAKNYTVGNSPISLLSKDFNHDARPDLAVANSTDGTISILFGLGDGTFLPPKTFATNLVIQEMLAVDITGDDTIDLVLHGRKADNLKDDLVVFKNLGDGVFKESSHFQIAFNSSSLVFSDINFDKKPDIFLANENEGTIFLFKNLGNDSFDKVILPITANPSDLNFMDLNNDHHPELLILDRKNQTINIATYRNDEFKIESISNLRAVPSSIIELSNSSTSSSNSVFGIQYTEKRNLFSPNSKYNFLEVFNNNLGSNGLFDLSKYGDNPSKIILATTPEGGAKTVLVAYQTGSFTPLKLNADNLIRENINNTILLAQAPLIAQTNRNTPSEILTLTVKGEILIRISKDNNNFKYSPAIPAQTLFRFSQIELLETVNGNVFVGLDDNKKIMHVFSLKSNGSYLELATYSLDFMANKFIVRDLNGDGRNDIFIIASGSISTLIQQQEGSFSKKSLIVSGNLTDAVILSSAFDDLPDIAITCGDSGTVMILRNDGLGNFSLSGRFLSDGNIRYYDYSFKENALKGKSISTALTTADFDEDGFNDLVITNYISGTVAFLKGDSDNNFYNPLYPITLPLKNLSHSFQVRTMDFNGDNHSDLGFLDTISGEFFSYMGNGHGEFSERSAFSGGFSPKDFSFRDMNNDRILDLVFTNLYGDITFFTGVGDGTFESYFSNDNKTPFTTSDLNGDGLMDIVWSRRDSDFAATNLRKLNKKEFTEPTASFGRINGLNAPGDVQMKDLDGLFGDDLVIANTGGNGLLIYLRMANGEFEMNPINFATGTNPVKINFSQLNDDNGDGSVNQFDLVDVLVANEGSNDISILYGKKSANPRDILLPGPRLATGGSGTSAVFTADVNNDGIIDIVSANSFSDSVSIINGIGSNGISSGFFNDNSPRIFNVPGGINSSSLLDANTLLALTSQGLTQVNLSSGLANLIFNSTSPITAFDSISSSQILAADASGTFTLLSGIGGGVFSIVDSFDTNVSNPMFIEAFAGDSGNIEVYFTQTDKNGVSIFSLDDSNMRQPIAVEDPSFNNGELALITFSMTGDITNVFAINLTISIVNDAHDVLAIIPLVTTGIQLDFTTFLENEENQYDYFNMFETENGDSYIYDGAFEEAEQILDLEYFWDEKDRETVRDEPENKNSKFIENLIIGFEESLFILLRDLNLNIIPENTIFTDNLDPENLDLLLPFGSREDGLEKQSDDFNYYFKSSLSQPGLIVPEINLFDCNGVFYSSSDGSSKLDFLFHTLPVTDKFNLQESEGSHLRLTFCVFIVSSWVVYQIGWCKKSKTLLTPSGGTLASIRPNTGDEF